MESNRKRRGIRGKLGMSFNLAPKPSVQQFSSKVIPSPSSSASHGYVEAASDKYHDFIVPSTKPKATSVTKVDQKSIYSEETASEVDRRAARYISCVQERFRMDC